MFYKTRNISYDNLIGDTVKEIKDIMKRAEEKKDIEETKEKVDLLIDYLGLEVFEGKELRKKNKEEV